MIFSENRFPLFGIMLYRGADGGRVDLLSRAAIARMMRFEVPEGPS
jgi:hypothetical protein